MSQSPKLQRPARRSLGYGSDTRPESPLARSSSPHSGTHGVPSRKPARSSPVSDPGSHPRHVHASNTHPRSPKPTRKTGIPSLSAARLNQTYPGGRFSDIEYSSGESDARSGYDSYEGTRRERSPRYHPAHDNDYSVGGNHSLTGVYHHEDYPYGGSQPRIGYSYDRPNTHYWNCTPPAIDPSGGQSPRYSTPVYAYGEEPDRAAELARQAKKAVMQVERESTQDR